MFRCAVFVLFLRISDSSNLFGIPDELRKNDNVISATSDTIANAFSDEYISYIMTGVESAMLRQLSKELVRSSNKNNTSIESFEELNAADKFFTCTTCRATLNILVRMFRNPDDYFNSPNLAVDSKGVMLDLCRRFEFQTEEVCSSLVDINWPVLDHIIKNSTADSRSICGTLPIKFCQPTQLDFNWSLEINQNSTAIDGPKATKPRKSKNDLYILHVTDIHYDPDYVVGSLAECDEPLCCQRHTVADDHNKAAGYWSDYRRCDSPLHMIEVAFDHMKEAHVNIDYIYQTGDIVPHNIWNTSKESNNKVLMKINDLISKKFPSIPVYSSVGNHEPHPTNVFPTDCVPENFSLKWLYEHLYHIWSRWLPVITKETILKGGYYTVVPREGLRIISLNNNDCYLFNWWIYNSGKIGIEQLQWLHDTLLAAEKVNENVHILAHIPSGDSDCWTVWSREYNRIIERFHNTISGIFNGHTHRDEMNVHYSSKGHAVGISWNGGSLSTYSFKNPNYKMYQVEPKSMQVVEQETWIFNLTEANLYGAARSPVWKKDLQFSVDFTDDLSPAGIDALLERMAKDPNLLRKYWRHKMTSADPQLAIGCNKACLLSTICRLATTVYNNNVRCNELKNKLRLALIEENECTQSVNPNRDDCSGTQTIPKSPTLLQFSLIINIYFSIKLFLNCL